MSERSIVAPLVVFGLGAAGAWGAWHFLGPKRTGRDHDTESPKDGAPPPATSAPPATIAPPVPVEPQARPSESPPATVVNDELAVGASPPPSPPKAARDDFASRAFDPIFQVFTVPTRIPLAYFRALAWSESRLRPEIPGGLFQIQSKTRDDFAKRHKQDPASLDLTSPATNTAIAADTLLTISVNLTQKHPKQRHARPNWTNPRFVELLTLAWNTGASEKRGVGRVLDYFDDSGFYSGTIADVQKHAQAAGAVAWLREYPERYAYARAVAARFFAERDRDALLKASAFDPTGTLRRWAT